jgi:hypothetical protein
MIELETDRPVPARELTLAIEFEPDVGWRVVARGLGPQLSAYPGGTLEVSASGMRGRGGR